MTQHSYLYPGAGYPSSSSWPGQYLIDDLGDVEFDRPDPVWAMFDASSATPAQFDSPVPSPAVFASAATPGVFASSPNPSSYDQPAAAATTYDTPEPVTA